MARRDGGAAPGVIVGNDDELFIKEAASRCSQHWYYIGVIGTMMRGTKSLWSPDYRRDWFRHGMRSA